MIYPSGTDSGWRSLGGNATVGVYGYWYDRNQSHYLAISTYGPDGTSGPLYCDWLTSSWSGWSRGNC